MRIEIICTGDEALTGKITNTTSPHGAELEDVGLSVHWAPPSATTGKPLAAFELAATEPTRRS